MSPSSPAWHTGSPAQKAARLWAELEAQFMCPAEKMWHPSLQAGKVHRQGKRCIQRRRRVQSSDYRACEPKHKLATCLHGKAYVWT